MANGLKGKAKEWRESFVAGATNTCNVTAPVGDKLVLNWHGTPTQRDGVLKMIPVIRDKTTPGEELGTCADAIIANIHDDGMSSDGLGSNIQSIAMLWRVFTTRLDDGGTYGDLLAHTNMHAAFELHEQPNDQFKVTWKISVMKGRTPKGNGTLNGSKPQTTTPHVPASQREIIEAEIASLMEMARELKTLSETQQKVADDREYPPHNMEALREKALYHKRGAIAAITAAKTLEVVLRETTNAKQIKMLQHYALEFGQSMSKNAGLSNSLRDDDPKKQEVDDHGWTDSFVMSKLNGLLNKVAPDLAPFSYPIGIRVSAWVMPSWAVVAAIRGAEPSVERSVADRRAAA